MILFALPPTEFKVVDVIRHTVFAGKLGQRVSEEMVVAQGETRIRVQIRGTYHTMAVREGSRLHVGDTVTIRGDVPADGAIIARDRIRKVKI